MPNHAVMLKITPCLRIECKFWLGDDGWNGSSEELPLRFRQIASHKRKVIWKLRWGDTSNRF